MKIYTEYKEVVLAVNYGSLSLGDTERDLTTQLKLLLCSLWKMEIKILGQLRAIHSQLTRPRCLISVRGLIAGTYWRADDLLSWLNRVAHASAARSRRNKCLRQKTYSATPAQPSGTRITCWVPRQ